MSGQGDTFNLSGDFRGAIVNIKSTLTQVQQKIGGIPHADEGERQELRDLVQKLSEALQQVPPEKTEEAEAVAAQAERMVEEAQKEKPNKSLLRITGEGLKEAASALAEVVPTALTIATQIVTTLGKLGGF